MTKCSVCGQDKGTEPRTLSLPIIGEVVLLDWEIDSEDCQFCNADANEARHREEFHQAVGAYIDGQIDKGNLIPK